VLHCPSSTGGNPQSLARAEREVGLQSRAISFQASPFQYPSDEILCRPTDSTVRKLLGTEVMRWPLLRRALRDFDIVHLNFGETIMPNAAAGIARAGAPYAAWLYGIYRLYARLLEMRDLPLLRRAGKGIAVTFQGDDARQGDFCRRRFEVTASTEVEPGYYDPRTDEHKRRRIARFARYADRIYSVNPDLLRVLPPGAEFVPYASVDMRQWSVVPEPPGRSDVPVVVHAPSHRGVKGTRFILEAVDRLKAEGVRLEFVLVEGLSNAEARRLYERADLLVDQLLIGWYGAVAVEVMALGKPAICYVRDEDLEFIPEGMRRDMPIIGATPGTIYEVLKTHLTVRRRELAEIGRRSRAYVERWHDPLKIAARMKADYEAILASKKPAS
jgi:glycosyltransferase involved in cell wall biosynthesis